MQSLQQQIGQLFMVGFPGTEPTPEIRELIEHDAVGGIVLFARNIASVQQLQTLTTELQTIARASGQRYPLLISIDQENGMVRRFGRATTIFPGNMALGAIGSEQMAYEVALATGRELKALGINMNLAPVADVNNNPANPVIGVRSFGEDPEQVARLTAAMVRGYREAGIITSLKHFPGHGDTSVDSHLALPTLPYDRARLHSLELVPFKRGIKAGADSIMLAHLYLPLLMHDEPLPATVSPIIVRDLLRSELGYSGVILTDCLEMKAVARTVGVERGAVMALQAGCDLILISHQYKRQKDSLQAVRAAIEDGTLSAIDLAASIERVQKLKVSMLSWQDALQRPSQTAQPEIGNPAHQRLRDRAYELSTTLVRDEKGLVPLHLEPAQPLLLLFLQPENYTQVVDRFEAAEMFVEDIRQRHANTAVQTISSWPAVESDEALEHMLRDFAAIIAITVNANLDQYQRALIQRLLATGKPVIGLAVYNPYDLLAFPHLGTYLVTYEYTPPALSTAARVLFGEAEARGHLPVSLPGLYPLARH